MSYQQKNIPIIKIIFEGDSIPVNLVQLAHSQLTGYQTRSNEIEYALDQSKWLRDEGYFMIAMDTAIPKIASILKKEASFHFYHESEDFNISNPGIEYYHWTQSRIGLSHKIHFYTLSNWCPFDQEDHWQFKHILQGETFTWKQSIFEQRDFLEQLVRKHLLILMKQFRLYIKESEIYANFYTLNRVKNRWVNHFNDETGILESFPMWAFSGVFATNLIIPPYLGIGRSVRYANGIVTESILP